MKYEIGQQVWIAAFEATKAHVECPDCAGTGRLRVMFHDDAIVSIECAGCSCGYEPPTGTVPFYTWAKRAKLATITGVEISEGKTEWHTDESWRVTEDKMFDIEAEALAAAGLMAEEHNKAEREKINQKEKPARTWSWNAHYHRREIKDAQRRLEYHSAKLAVANIKAKDDKRDAVSSPQWDEQ